MRLDEVLSKLSAEDLERLEHSPLWQSSVQEGLSLREAMLDRNVLERAANDLSFYASEVLQTLLKLFGAEPVEEERLMASLREYSNLAGAECRIGLGQLEEGGLLFSVKKAWGERIYFLPLDCFLLWQQIWFPYRPSEAPGRIRPLMKETGEYAEVNEPFGRRLLYMLAALILSDSKVTTKGVLSKKTIHKLQQALKLEAEGISSFGLKWAHSEHYPLGVAFALSAGGALGLLKQEDDGLKLNEAELYNWFGLSNPKRERLLLEWVCGYMLRSSGAGAYIAAAMLSLPENNWFSESEVESWFQQSFCKRESRKDSGSEYRGTKQWCQLFYELGWLELAEIDNDVDNCRVFRWRTHLSAETCDLVVQPTGEIFAGAGCSFANRWELELIGERKSGEDPIVYRLSSTTITAALELGRTNISIIGFLREASGMNELPGTVEAMLEEWCSRACRFSFAQATLLRCDSADEAKLAMQLPELSPLLLCKLGDRDFIVEGSSVGDIRRLLQKAGYPPRKGILSSNSDAAVAERARTTLQRGSDYVERSINVNGQTASWLYEPLTLRHFEIDRLTWRSKQSPMQGMEEVPAAWWLQLRSYHLSTRVEMLRQAVSIGAAVQLNFGGELCSFVPEQVEQRGADWWVTGKRIAGDQFEKVRLSPDMWEEMRMVMPEGLQT